MLTVDDAIEFIIDQIVKGPKGDEERPLGDHSEVWFLHVLQNFVRRQQPAVAGSELPQHFPSCSSQFLDAAHELMRRGILRLGPSRFRLGQTDLGVNNQFVLTEYGRRWIEARRSERTPPGEPGRYAELISEYAKLFGAGFHQRATEAIKCYHTQAYLACCVMVGAAAESILLHVAIEKVGDEARVLKTYKCSGGTGKVKDLVLQGRTSGERQHFEGIFELMKYWRDESAHGLQSNLSELQAYMSLYLLIRHASYVRDNIAAYISRS